VVDALRDDIAASLDLQQDGRRVRQLVPVRQGGEAARTHHPVQLSLHGIIGPPQTDKHLPPSTFTGQFLRKAGV
jgi:hypothetical protein